MAEDSEAGAGAPEGTIEPIASAELALLRERFGGLRRRRRALGEALETLSQMTEDLGAEAFKRMRQSGAAEAQVARFEEAKERAIEEAEERRRELLEAERALGEVVGRLSPQG